MNTGNIFISYKLSLSLSLFLSLSLSQGFKEQLLQTSKSQLSLSLTPRGQAGGGWQGATDSQAQPAKISKISLKSCKHFLNKSLSLDLFNKSAFRFSIPIEYSPCLYSPLPVTSQYSYIVLYRFLFPGDNLFPT